MKIDEGVRKADGKSVKARLWKAPVRVDPEVVFPAGLQKQRSSPALIGVEKD